MKRILPLILTVLFLPALLAVPVMAAENDTWYSLLDYGTLDNSGNNYIWMNSNDFFSYDMPFLGQVRNVDLIISSSYSFNSVQISRDNTNWVSATVYDLGNDMKRISFSGALSGEGFISVKVISSSDVIYLTVVSFRISYVALNTFASAIYGNIVHGPNLITTSQLSYSGGESQSNSVSLGNGSTGTYLFRSTLYFLDWVKFDYLSFGINAKVSTITSIAAYVNGQSVPIEVVVSPFSGIKPDNYFYSISLDLTGIDKNYGYNDSTFDSLYVVITGDYQDGDGVTDSIQIAYSTGSVIVAKQSVLSYWFFQLETWFDELISAVGGDNNASGVTDNINTAVGELGEIQNVLDGVARPDLDAIDFDVSGLVDVSAAATYGNIFSTLIGNQYMTNILMIAFILAAASFLLFGRR